MGSPNQDLPGQCIMSGRRTDGRRYYLAPSSRTFRIQKYAYAYAVQKSGIVPFVEMTMSNHRHGVFLDVRGERSEFHANYHGIVGRYVNGALRRSGYFWDNQGPSSIVILQREGSKPGPTSRKGKDKDQGILSPPFAAFCDERDLDITDRFILYTLLNPVMANLVDAVHNHPGFKITPQHWGKKIEVMRPVGVSRGYPDVVEFTPMPPPRWEGKPLEEAKRYYLDLLTEAEDHFARRREKHGRGVLGRRKLLEQNPFDAPKSTAPYNPSKPRFAGDPADVSAATVAYSKFVEAHGLASRRFRLGERDVTFPAGTVQMRKLAGVRCRGCPLPHENPMP